MATAERRKPDLACNSLKKEGRKERRSVAGGDSDPQEGRLPADV